MSLYAQISVDLPLPNPFTYRVPGNLTASVVRGVRVRVNFNHRETTGVVVSVTDTPPSGDAIKLKEILSVVDPAALVTDELFDLAEWMAGYYVSSLGECLSMMIPSARSDGTRQVFEPPSTDPSPGALDLNREQEAVYRIVSREIRTHEFKSSLLYGVTGSGKTEVYLHLIRDCLAEGRSAIFLIPEISLATQTHRHLCRYFDEKEIAVFHSRLTPNQRLLEWRNLREGRKRIVVGPRSAVFAPVRDLGLIVIDEEHSATYKEHSRPRYHARQAAFFRCRAAKAVLLLGSATPSVESYHLARSGQYGLHLLKKRFNEAALPAIGVVEHKPTRDVISPVLAEKISDRLKRGEQVIVFFNRRGFADVLYCGACGHSEKCPNCSISLTYHKPEPGTSDRKARLECHYCGYTSAVKPACSQCGQEALVPLGAGTQKIEVSLQKLFPGARIERFDMDSTRRKGRTEEIYENFLKRRIDILVGTQMVSKGLHFPGVTLVGVVGFEAMVNMPDFRSFENTVGLLFQVAGRTGRGDDPGEVVIQAQDARHPVIRFLKNHDYDEFFENEIKVRRQAGYPPFMRLVRILVRSRNEANALRKAESLANALKREHGLFTRVLGPVPAPFAKLNRYYRFHIICKLSKRDKRMGPLLASFQSDDTSKDCRLEIDIDPVSLL